jgi:hypothetical protein
MEDLRHVPECARPVRIVKNENKKDSKNVGTIKTALKG